MRLVTSPDSMSIGKKLSHRTKLAYGVGEVSRAAIQNIRVVFLLYFLTNVAGLNAALAGTLLLIGRIWDGINDPIVGWLSDRTRSRWGKRYPWIMGGLVPLAVLSVLQWIVPHFNQSDRLNQLSLFWYYTLVTLLFDAAFTAVIVPYSALAPDLARNYHERTSLTSFQMGCSIVGGISILLLAQLIFSWVPDPNQKYLILGICSSAMVVVAILVSVLGTYRHLAVSPSVYAVEQQNLQVTVRSSSYSSYPSLFHSLSWSELYSQVYTIFCQREFQLVTGIYVFSWISIQVMVAILPYFIQIKMHLAPHHVTQIVILMQGTALSLIPIWRSISQRVGKKGVFVLGIPVLIAGQIGLSLLQAEQIHWMYGCAIGIGIGLATVYLVPWSMLPDVIDLDELRYGQRREGMFYSLMLQMQKFGLAIALFLASQGLNWAGLIPAAGGMVPVQPKSVLITIQAEIGLIPAMVMIFSLGVACCYPLNQRVHQTVLSQLQARKTSP